MGSGEWEMTLFLIPHSPLPTPHSPFPSLARLRNDAQIRLQGLPAAGEFLLGSFVGDRRDDDAVFALLPVDRRRHAVFGRQLDRVHDAQDFVEVAARGRRVSDHRFHLLVRPDEVDRPDGENVAHFRVDHVVEPRYLLFGIRNYWEIERRALRLLDVLGPLLVRIDRVDAQTEDLDATLLEFGFELGHIAEFRGADRSEILRVREEDRPTVADPFVEAFDRAFGSLRAEIRNDFTNA